MESVACRMCLKPAKLEDSHIIPDFLFKRLKLAEGYFLHLSSVEAKKDKKAQRGITEKLLCRECEAKLSKYEDQLARVLYNSTKLKGVNHGFAVHMHGIPYQPVKLALLSILWRMHLSSHPFFSQVNLADQHTERLRIAFLEDKMIPETEYFIVCIVPKFDGKFEAGWILEPESGQVKNDEFFLCLLCGFYFMFFIGPGDFDPNLPKMTLREDGSWVISVQEVRKIPSLNQACEQLGMAIKLKADRTK